MPETTGNVVVNWVVKNWNKVKSAVTKLNNAFSRMKEIAARVTLGKRVEKALGPLATKTDQTRVGMQQFVESIFEANAALGFADKTFERTGGVLGKLRGGMANFRDTTGRLGSQLRGKLSPLLTNLTDRFWALQHSQEERDAATEKGITQTEKAQSSFKKLGQTVTKAGWKMGFFGWIASYAILRIVDIMRRLAQFSINVFRSIFQWTVKLINSIVKWQDGLEKIAFGMGLLEALGLASGDSMAFLEQTLNKLSEIGPKFQALFAGFTAIMLGLAVIVADKMLPYLEDLFDIFQDVATSDEVITFLEDFADSMFGTVLPALGDALTLIPNLLDGMGGPVGEALGTMMAAFAPLISALLPVLLELIIALSPAFVAIADAIIESIPFLYQMIPPIVRIVYAIAALIPGMAEGAVMALQLAAVFFEVMKPFAKFIPLLIVLLTVLMVLSPVISVLGLVIGVLGTTVGVIAIAIAGLVILGMALYWALTEIDKRMQLVTKTGFSLIEILIMMFSPFTIIYFLILRVIKAFQVFNYTGQKLEKLWVRGSIIPNLIAGFRLLYDMVFKYIMGVVSTITKLSNVASKAYSWGKKLIDGFLNGLKSGDVKGTIEKIANKIADYLGISSEAKIGPLSELESWAPAFMQTFSSGLLSGIPRLERAAERVAGATLPTAPILPGLAGPTGMTVEIPISITIGEMTSEADIDYMVDEVDKRLSERLREWAIR